ncbi:MAG: hypothetical protein JO218_13850 [Burkholderiales bacterium]|nr:hypothetical protein [Burkholderiales bacterium]
MTWQPISESKLWDLINAAEARMTPRRRRMWDAVRVTPAKWAEPSYGELGGGFWVVGIQGETVVWYNDIEGGFNRSPYKTPGTIADYRCNQDELEHVMEYLLGRLEFGYDTGPIAGAPQAGEYRP